ncbi:jg4724 [Pararge aegeria aegeria]|uniref:Jg4724 protein n=1 Tax=Pararge aegeria aegeria TaxID=348720 RepID=A0A8S4SFK6_9NEOP|nr:jg4724 [Pararge aegeria aegeria]
MYPTHYDMEQRPGPSQKVVVYRLKVAQRAMARAMSYDRCAARLVIMLNGLMSHMLARNIEYKDPVEEEWEKFQKEIKEETTTSAEIIAGEQEEATAERQIDEIDEQMRNWSRVLDLELKKEETKKKIQDIEMLNEDDYNDSENEADIDEFLDWRAKKSYS